MSMTIAPNKGSYRLDQWEVAGPSADQTVQAGLGRDSEPSVLGLSWGWIVQVAGQLTLKISAISAQDPPIQ